MPNESLTKGPAQAEQEPVEVEDLVARAQGGDLEAIGELYDQHHVSVLKYAWSRVGDRETAEDLTGEVFLRMVRALPKYRRTKIPFRAWLYRIARNLVIDHYRMQSDQASVPLEVAENTSNEGDHPAKAVDRALKMEQLHGALTSIKPSERDVVVLRFLVGLSIRETAMALGKSEPSVKAMQHRGLAALREAFSQQGGR